MKGREDRRTLLVVGSGFVGGNLCVIAARGGWTVHAVDTVARRMSDGIELHLADATDRVALRSLVRAVRPSAVVDLAAIADIDRAEREHDLAWAVNVEAARTVAACCHEASAACVYVSSDAVFAGTAESYGEDDPPQPVNWYGRTKAEGEKAVATACPSAAVIRISLVLGFPTVGTDNSFFAGLEAKLRDGRVVEAPADEIRTPVDVITLCECILEIADRRLGGVFHIGATESVDRLSLARRVAARMGYPPERIAAPAAAAAKPGRAARHKRGVIRVDRARSTLRTPLLTVEDSLRRAFDERIALP